MSILYRHEIGCIISHSNFINKIYENLRCNSDQNACSFTIQEDLFNIEYPFKMSHCGTTSELIDINSKRRKRKISKYPNLDLETLEIKNKLDIIIKSAKSNGILPSTDMPVCEVKDEATFSNEPARKMAEMCSSVSLCLRGFKGLSGGNNSPFPLLQTLKECDVLIPANCRFICGDVRNTLQKLDGEIFDVIILDPPWWNKYIRRSKAKRPECSYDMLYNSEIADLPVESLLSDNGVIVIWCTNCAVHEKDIKEKMFKKWNVQYRATWYWMKITKYGIPMCPFTESTGKKPYERLIIGTRGGVYDDKMKTFAENLIISIPSALHSHKPPLNDVLAPYLPVTSPKYLEIFSRYLLPNTTSVGLEPLRWQHSALYTKVIN